jgi:hypothetical protein
MIDKLPALLFVPVLTLGSICEAGPVCDRVADLAPLIVDARDANVGIGSIWLTMREEWNVAQFAEMRKTVALIYLHPEEFTEENASEMILNNCRGDL